jgi:hypothetical protein
MKTGTRTTLRLLAALVVALGAAGCATPKYRVTGTVTRGGKPLHWEGERVMLLVLFAPLDRAKHREVYRAESNAQAGTYVIAAIPAGTYRVSLQLMDPYPDHDLLRFAYSLKDSPLVYEVDGDKEINIDLPEAPPRGAKPAFPKPPAAP